MCGNSSSRYVTRHKSAVQTYTYIRTHNLDKKAFLGKAEALRRVLSLEQARDTMLIMYRAVIIAANVFAIPLANNIAIEEQYF